MAPTPSAAARTLPLFKEEPPKAPKLVCRYPGCKAERGEQYTMCWDHWRLVPDAVRSQYWDLRQNKPDSPALMILAARTVALAKAPAPVPIAPPPPPPPPRPPPVVPGRTPEPAKVVPLAPRRISLPIRPKSDYDPRAHGALCDECPCRGRVVVPPTPVAPHVGPPAGVIVGMAPGWEEQRQRKSFVGISGKKLDRALEKNGLKRDVFHITNASLCMPEKEEQFSQAYKCCKPRLENELQQLPKATPVITLGAPAFASSFGRKMPITQARGFVWTHKDGRVFLPTVHPAYVLRDAVQSPLWNIDWNRIARYIRGDLTTVEPPSWIVPKTVSELLKALVPFKNAKWVSCDIETTKDTATRCELLCVGISDGKHTVVVPWEKAFKPYLANFFKGRTVVGHNFILFDSIVHERYEIPVGRIEDTIIAHHAYASHFRQGMDHVASVYLDVPPWKVQYGLRGTDEKGQPKSNLSNEELYKYNAYDAYIQAHMFVKMQKDIAANRALYEHDLEVADACREMTMLGVWVDEPRRKEIAQALHAKIDRLFARMKETCGHDFSPTKTVDLRKIFFEEFGARVIERTPKKGEPSTGKNTLQAFALELDKPYGRFAADLIQWRLCCKVLKTHVEGLPIEEDGRVHAGWKSFATPTGRVGVRKPNLNNMKREDKRFKGEPEYRIREIYAAPPGTQFVGFDFSQIEPHMSAYLSGDPAFIEAVGTGDIHTAIARIIFGENEPKLKDSKTAKTEGGFMRQIAKSCGLAVNYLAGEETLFETLRKDGFNVKFSQVVTMLSVLKRKFKGYFDFVDRNIAFCRKHGYIIAGFATGRKRWLGHAPEPQKIGNTPCQGGAADVMNFRMIEMRKHFNKKHGRGVVKMVMQVYDSIIFEVPDALVESVKEDIKMILGTPWVINGRSVKLPFELKSGVRLSEV
jgi:uracil-DNA glycosylase family 4